MVLVFLDPNNDLFRVPITRQIVNVRPAAEGDLARNTSAVPGGGAHKHGLSADFYEEMSKLAREKAVLGSGRAEVCR